MARTDTANIEMRVNGNAPIILHVNQLGDSYVKRAVYGFTSVSLRRDYGYANWMKRFAENWSSRVQVVETPCDKATYELVFMPDRKQITIGRRSGENNFPKIDEVFIAALRKRGYVINQYKISERKKLK
jgi:hypothetical protein